MKYKRYYSTFGDIYNNLYRIEIMQEATTAYTAEEIKLDVTPLVIEWPDMDKTDPVYSSSATLNLWSDSDRKFSDLISVEVKAIRLDVYKNNSL